MSRPKDAQEPQEKPTKLVTVTAVHPFQIGYEGVVVGPGDSLKAPEELAEQWVAAGFATR